MNIQSFILEKTKKALLSLEIPQKYQLKVRQTKNKSFGDYQIDGILSISKKTNQNPKDLAKKILKKLFLNKIAEKIEIIFPNFINIYLKKVWILKNAFEMISKKRLGIYKTKNIKNIIIDYSSPNIAKQMHVGHLRSTIIGDSIARILEFLGHNVIRVNHLGDWGMQVAILLSWIQKFYQDKKIIFENLESFYKKAKISYEKNLEFYKYANNFLKNLQKENIHCLSIWKKFVKMTIKKNQKIYNQLNVSLKEKHIFGESFYKNLLPEIVSDLLEKKIAIKHQGAIVVFLDEFKNKTGKKMGVIIEKKDGGYLYTTTDLACIKYRCKTLHADRILYFTDIRQAQHLKQVFIIAKKANYISQSVSFEHHTFGMMLNEKKEPFKTRSGENIKLSFFLNEAIIRASKIIKEKKPNILPKELKKIAKCIGIASLKYADLSKNRNTNYIFKWENMLSFEGNTALYIQYCYVRISSILKKYLNTEEKNSINKIDFNSFEKEEIFLTIKLLQFEETLFITSKKAMPHILCNYLYNLASSFTSFYEKFPILKTSNKKISYNRIQLCKLVSKVLKKGLNLLGINTINTI